MPANCCLHAAGLTHRQLQRLRADDLAITDRALTIRVVDAAIKIPAGPRGVCGLCIWVQWRQILHITTNHPGIRTIRDAFWRTPPTPTADSTDHRHSEVVGPVGGRVFGQIDRYGYFDRRTSLSLRTISHRITRYHNGDIPAFRYQQPPPLPVTKAPIAMPQAPPVTTRSRITEPERLRRHGRSLRQLASDRVKLDRLDQVFDELDERIDALTARAGMVEQELKAEMSRCTHGE